MMQTFVLNSPTAYLLLSWLVSKYYKLESQILGQRYRSNSSTSISFVSSVLLLLLLLLLKECY